MRSLVGSRASWPSSESRVQVVQPVDPLADRVEVGQQAAQPALVHVQHAGLLGDVPDRVLGLLLGPDEQDHPALGGQILHEGAGPLQQDLGLQQVDDVDAVSLAEDVAAHLRVPAARLMAEVDSGLQQLLYAYVCHGAPFLCCALSRRGGLAGPERALWLAAGRAATVPAG